MKSILGMIQIGAAEMIQKSSCLAEIDPQAGVSHTKQPGSECQLLALCYVGLKR